MADRTISSMSKPRKALLIAEKSVGALCVFLAVVTVFWRDWIEVLFGWDPDHHSGSAETRIICGLAVAGLALALMARWQHRRWSSPQTVPDAA